MACSKLANYTDRLKLRIQPVFPTHIKPLEILHIFHSYNPGVLNKADMDKVRAVTDRDGNHGGSLELLDRLCCYKDGYDCLQKVLRDRNVNLGHIADAMDKDKASLDTHVQQGTTSLEDENRRLKEELQRLKGREIGSCKRDEEEQKTDKIATARNKVKKYQGKIITEFESLANITTEERKSRENKIKELEGRIKELEGSNKELKGNIKELEENSSQKDKQISELKIQSTNQLNAIQNLLCEKKEKNSVILTQRTELEKYRATALDLALTFSSSNGVTVFSMCMRTWMLKYNPDIARKYSISKCVVPDDFHGAVAWMTETNLRPLLQSIRILTQKRQHHGTIAPKRRMKVVLQAFQSQLNSIRDSEDGDAINGVLQRQILHIFSYCYVTLLELEIHGVQHMIEFVMECRNSISQVLDPIVDCEAGGWNELMSKATFERFCQNPQFSTLWDNYVQPIFELLLE